MDLATLMLAHEMSSCSGHNKIDHIEVLRVHSAELRKKVQHFSLEMLRNPTLKFSAFVCAVLLQRCSAAIFTAGNIVVFQATATGGTTMGKSTGIAIIELPSGVSGIVSPVQTISVPSSGTRSCTVAVSVINEGGFSISQVGLKKLPTKGVFTMPVRYLCIYATHGLIFRMKQRLTSPALTRVSVSARYTHRVPPPISGLCRYVSWPGLGAPFREMNCSLCVCYSGHSR
jgi:hypothetical protein